jgi:putative tryptophan/tyrosine transport system substrate-binding protein
MRRRNFIFGLMAVVTTGGAHAAERKSSHRIAIVLPSAPVTVISDELRRLGHVEGDNLVIERYSGEGRAPRYPELARDVVSRDPDMIFAIGNYLVLDFKAATTAIRSLDSSAFQSSGALCRAWHGRAAISRGSL